MEQSVIIEVNAKNFQEVVINNSMKLPVLVDFWAPWCEPCKQITPQLEQLAKESAGQFILAKINTEDQQELAAQFEIRSIPTFKIYHKGEEVKELQGALPISEFKKELEPFLAPDVSETLRQQAQQKFISGDYDQAIKLLGEASQINPNNFKVHLDLVQMYMHTDNLDKALNLFNKLPDEAKQSSEGKSLGISLHFAQIVSESDGIESIQKKLKENPNDMEALYHLSGYLILHNKLEEAIQSMLKIFTTQADYKDGIAKKTLLKVFDAMNEKYPELINTYRRKLQNLLF